MMGGTTTIGKVIQTVRLGEVALAKIAEKIATTTPEQEADEELVDTLKYARGAITQLKELIEDIQL